jgi:hypothetical protein
LLNGTLRHLMQHQKKSHVKKVQYCRRSVPTPIHSLFVECWRRGGIPLGTVPVTSSVTRRAANVSDWLKPGLKLVSTREVCCYCMLVHLEPTRPPTKERTNVHCCHGASVGKGFTFTQFKKKTLQTFKNVDVQGVRAPILHQTA